MPTCKDQEVEHQEISSLEILMKYINIDFKKFTLELRDLRQELGKIDARFTTIENKIDCMETSNAQLQCDVKNLRMKVVLIEKISTGGVRLLINARRYCRS